MFKKSLTQILFLIFVLALSACTEEPAKVSSSKSSSSSSGGDTGSDIPVADSDDIYTDDDSSSDDDDFDGVTNGCGTRLVRDTDASVSIDAEYFTIVALGRGSGSYDKDGSWYSKQFGQWWSGKDHGSSAGDDGVDFNGSSVANDVLNTDSRLILQVKAETAESVDASGCFDLGSNPITKYGFELVVYAETDSGTNITLYQETHAVDVGGCTGAIRVPITGDNIEGFHYALRSLKSDRDCQSYSEGCDSNSLKRMGGRECGKFSTYILTDTTYGPQ